MALDLTGPKTPPPSRAGARRAQTVRPSTTKRQEREDGLSGLFQVGAALALMAGQPADAAAVADHGTNIAHEAAVIADQNEKMAKALDYVTAVGPFAALLGAAMPLVLQLLVNHGRLPMVPVLQGMGVKDPKALEAKAKADALRQVMEAQREQAEAEAELAHAIAQANAQAHAQANGRPTPTDVRL